MRGRPLVIMGGATGSQASWRLVEECMQGPKCRFRTASEPRGRRRSARDTMPRADVRAALAARRLVVADGRGILPRRATCLTGCARGIATKLPVERLPVQTEDPGRF